MRLLVLHVFRPFFCGTCGQTGLAGPVGLLLDLGPLGLAPQAGDDVGAH